MSKSKTQSNFYNKASLSNRPRSTINFQAHPKQKLYNHAKPSREYRRFPQEKIYGTGVDSNGNYQHFMSKDIIQPLERPNLYETSNSNQRPSSVKWSLRTTKNPPNFEKLPKFQQYKEYFFPPPRTQNDIDSYRIRTLKTDYIGLKVPKNITKANANPNYSYLKMKNEYSISSTSNSAWAPKSGFQTINNISSKNYNIINFLPANHTIDTSGKILDKTINHKTKGVGEYADLTRTYRTNFNSNYQNLVNENPYRFRRFTGIFSRMYDSAHQNGNLSCPFEKNIRNNPPPTSSSQ